MEGSPGCDLPTESSHGREKVRTSFKITGVGKRMHCYRRYEVLLTDDPRSSPPQSPTGTGTGLGSVIGDWAIRLNCTPR